MGVAGLGGYSFAIATHTADKKEGLFALHGEW